MDNLTTAQGRAEQLDRLFQLGNLLKELHGSLVITNWITWLDKTPMELVEDELERIKSLAVAEKRALLPALRAIANFRDISRQAQEGMHLSYTSLILDEPMKQSIDVACGMTMAAIEHQWDYVDEQFSGIKDCMDTRRRTIRACRRALRNVFISCGGRLLEHGVRTITLALETSYQWNIVAPKAQSKPKRRRRSKVQARNQRFLELDAEGKQAAEIVEAYKIETGIDVTKETVRKGIQRAREESRDKT